MARIYDNLETKFTDGLQGIISNVGVKRVNFCVGYFNLRGWNLIVNEVDQLSGDFVYEQNDRIFRTCRLLIGMHRPDEDLVRSLYSGKKQMPDAEYVQKCRIAIARDFKKFLEVSGNGYSAFLHILGIGHLFLTGIETSNEVFVWSVHADKESAGAEYAVVLFIYEITG